MKKKKDIIAKQAFPDYLASDEVKNTEEYGLQMAKAIEYEWWFRPENGTTCSYYDKREKHHQLRLYARGEQDTKLYKDLITGGDETSFSNYDWRPLQIVPKFVKLITNQMNERLFDVKAEAVDKFSTDLKDDYKRGLEDYLMAKPIADMAQESLGLDLKPSVNGELPETQEEIDLYMSLKYKPAIEIASEEAIKYTLDLNDYDETQSRVLEDVTTLGLGAIKHSTDPTKGIMVEYVDPSDLVYSYPRHRNFKNVHYYGEVTRITINELKRLSGDKFTDDELRDIAKATPEWNKYHNNTSGDQYREDDLGGMMIDILHFTFKSSNTITYKKKYSGNGGFKMTKRESTFRKKSKKYDGYDVSKKVIDVWYEGSLILGTQNIFNYKLCENMIRPKGNLNRTIPNYILYAPELYQNRTRSLVERIIPYVDQMQQIHIKLQQLIAKARPNGVFIDVDGLEEIAMGDGNFLTPLEVIKIYDQTGNVLGASKTAGGEYNHGKEPIRELRNGVVDGLDQLIFAYNHYLTLLRDAIGVPQGADASTPHPKMAVGVQQNLAMNSNTATRHILDSVLNMTERLGKGLALRIKDIFEYSNLKDAYINAIGKINVDTLKALKQYHLHDLGINIELKPDSEEKQFLEQNIQQALGKESITLDDAIDIRSISNTKLANAFLKTRRIKREKMKKEHEMAMEEARGQAQAQAQQIAAQAKQMEIQAQNQSDLSAIQAKTQGRIQEINAEEQAKSRLMQQEFNYNVSLQQGKTQVEMGRDKYKEDRKDSRQAAASTQTSAIAEQKQYNKPARKFESSEDTMTGGIGMGDVGAS